MPALRGFETRAYGVGEGKMDSHVRGNDGWGGGDDVRGGRGGRPQGTPLRKGAKMGPRIREDKRAGGCRIWLASIIATRTSPQH